MNRVYLDTCIVIYLVEGVEPFYSFASQKLLQLTAEECQIYSSDLVYMESRVKPIKLKQHDIVEDFNHFFDTTIDKWCNFSRPLFDLATQLRAEHGLKTPDALHLAAAITHGCDEFWTNDNRLQKAASAHLHVINVFAAQESN